MKSQPRYMNNFFFKNWQEDNQISVKNLEQQYIFLKEITQLKDVY